MLVGSEIATDSRLPRLASAITRWAAISLVSIAPAGSDSGLKVDRSSNG